MRRRHPRGDRALNSVTVAAVAFAWSLGSSDQTSLRVQSVRGPKRFCMIKPFAAHSAAAVRAPLGAPKGAILDVSSVEEAGPFAGRDTASPLVLGADDTVNARASRFIPPELTESDLTPRLRLLLARLESLERLLGREDAPKGLEDRVVRLAHRIRNEMSVVLFARHAGRVPSRCVR
jgi:hypothetical protein